MKRILRLSASTVGSLLLVLGSGASAIQAVDRPTACSLFSQAEAAVALGGSIEDDVSPLENDVSSQCGFARVDDGSVLTIIIWYTHDPDMWRRLRPCPGECANELLRVTTLADLGDDAYLVDSGASASVRVLRGDQIIDMGVNLFTPGEASPALLDVVRTVLSRLP